MDCLCGAPGSPGNKKVVFEDWSGYLYVLRLKTVVRMLYPGDRPDVVMCGYGSAMIL